MQQDIRQLHDDQLLTEAKFVAKTERRLQARQVLLLGEIVRRRLHLREGYDSLFSYLVKELKYPKSCAYLRSTVAKAAGRYPKIIEMMERGELSLAAATVVAKHLNEKNGATLLEACAGKSKEEVEVIVAGHSKTPVIRDVIRPVGIRTETTTEPLPLAGKQPWAKSDEKGSATSLDNRTTNSATIAAAEIPVLCPPVNPKPDDVIVKVSFATNKRVTDKLGRVKDLLARKHPQGALSDVLEELLDDYINRHDPMVKAKRKAQACGKREAMQRDEVSEKREAMQRAEVSETVRASGRAGAKKSVEAPVTALSRYNPMAVKHEPILREGKGVNRKFVANLGRAIIRIDQ